VKRLARWWELRAVACALPLRRRDRSSVLINASMWDRSQESLVFVHSSADVAPPPAQPPAQPPTRRRGFLCCAGPASVDSVAAWPRRHARLDSRGVLCVFAQQGGDGEAPLLRLPLGGPDAAYRLVIPRCADVPRCACRRRLCRRSIARHCVIGVAWGVAVWRPPRCAAAVRCPDAVACVVRVFELESATAAHAFRVESDAVFLSWIHAIW
jgi:hypothetical protein